MILLVYWIVILGLVEKPVTHGSKYIDISHAMAKRFTRSSHTLGRRSLHEMVPRDLLDMADGEDLKEVDVETTATGTVAHKYQEFYHGLPVYGAFATFETDLGTNKYTGQADGHLLTKLETDILDMVPELTEKDMLEIAKQDTMLKYPGCKIDEEEETKMFIYDVNGTAVLAGQVSFRVHTNNGLRRPCYFIDANTGAIIKTFPKIKSYQLKSFGGNLKTGKHKFGHDMPYLTVEKHGDLCTLQNEYVSVYHMHNSEVEPHAPFTFNCTSGIHDSSNGGYSPLSDVFFYGTEVFMMFKEWIRLYPTDNLPLKIYVHNGVNDSAHFDPNLMAVIIGDGYPQYSYPYAALDVIGHEIGHLFSDNFPRLEYDGQTGGLCESLVDLTGEAAEWYVHHRADGMSGGDVYVHHDGRQLCKQHVDGRSIKNVNDFKEGMNVHYSSGVFNRFGCYLSETLTWKDIFRVFTYAARFYWCETTDFTEGGCGILKAGYDLGYDLHPFYGGLRDIGLEPCSLENHIRMISEYTEIKNLQVDSGNGEILFKVDFRNLNKNINKDVNVVQIYTSGGTGDVDLFVGFGADVSKKDAIFQSNLTGNAEMMYIENFFSVRILYLKLIPKSSGFSGVTLLANAL